MAFKRNKHHTNNISTQNQLMTHAQFPVFFSISCQMLAGGLNSLNENSYNLGTRRSNSNTYENDYSN